MIYYTADLHLGHENVIQHCSRPFATVEEMDAALIRNWNSRVHRNDTIYIVGDLFFRNRRSAEDYLGELKGRKHLVLGNHDLSWYKKGSGHGSFMVFGHIHNNTNAAFWPLIRGSPLLLNAGVDINEYRPVTLSELQVNNDAFKAEHPPGD